MLRFILAVLFLFHLSVRAVPAPTDYKLALELWNKLLKSAPNNIDAVLKVSELKFLVEGREPAEKILVEVLEKNWMNLALPTRKRLQEKLKHFQTVFLTDEGQVKYLQALSHIEKKNWQQALVLMNDAYRLERGNIKILDWKAKCEKQLQVFDQYYATLKETVPFNPYDLRLKEALAEAHIYFGKYAEAIELAEKTLAADPSAQRELIHTMAQFEAGNLKTATYTLQRLIRRHGALVVHPIVYYALGSLLIAESGTRKAGEKYLREFLKAARDPKRVSLDAWDPYRTKEKIALTQALLETPSSQGSKQVLG